MEIVGQVKLLAVLPVPLRRKKRAYANQPVLENLQTPNAIPKSYSQQESSLLQEMLAIF